jgi:hypothetical protein
MKTPRVLFVHGSESGPQGTKARLLAERFEASTPAMDTRDFERCVAQQADAIRRFRPDVVVGSSFGGGVAVALLQRGLWKGPTLLLAQAAREQGLRPELPDGVRVWIVHGTRDEVVPFSSSQALARSGSPELVRLIELDDDHRLSACVAGGRLVGLVRELAEAEQAPAIPPFERHVRAFLEEPALWPVLVAAAGIFASFLAAALLAALRGRNPPLLLALAGLIVASAELVRRDWRGARPGVVGTGVLLVWSLALLIAFVAGRAGLL